MGAKQNFNLGGINSHFNGLKDAGNMSPTQLALTYSKEQLQHMAQMGVINPTNAVIAGMNIDRISTANVPPTSTISQDTFAPQQPQQGQLPQQGQPPQQPPQGQPPQQGGIMSIPRPGQKYQQGGVVAFAEGDEVVAPSGFTGLKDLYDQIEAKREGIPNTQSQALQDYYAGAPERAKARSERDRNMNLVNIGSNIMAQSGVKGFGLQNIGKGVVASMPGIKAADTEEEERRLSGVKGLADTEQKRRTEAIEGQKSAEGIFKELRQAGIHAGKDTDMDTQIGTYVAYQKELAKLGKRTDNPSDSKLRNEAMDRIRADKIQAAQLSLSGVRGNTAVSQDRANIDRLEADIKRDEASRKEAKDVSDAVDKEFKSIIAPKGTKAYTYQELLRNGKFAEANLMHEQEVQRVIELRRAATRKAISSDETVAPVVNPPPLAAKLPPLKDVTVTRNK